MVHLFERPRVHFTAIESAFIESITEKFPAKSKDKDNRIDDETLKEKQKEEEKKKKKEEKEEEKRRRKRRRRKRRRRR